MFAYQDFFLILFAIALFLVIGSHRLLTLFQSFLRYTGRTCGYTCIGNFRRRVTQSVVSYMRVNFRGQCD